MILDHLAVAGETLEEAVAHVEAALGVRLGPGGSHARYGTHNRLLGLGDGLYLEAIAVAPGVEPETRPRWFDLDRFHGPSRLSNWICRVDDMDAALARWPEAGQAVALSRGDLKWRMAVPPDGCLPFDNLFPALIEWQVQTVPGDSLPGSGCALRHLTLRHPEAEALQARLGIDDAKISFETGAPGMQAVFRTPHGDRVLT